MPGLSRRYWEARQCRQPNLYCEFQILSEVFQHLKTILLVMHFFSSVPRSLIPQMVCYSGLFSRVHLKRIISHLCFYFTTSMSSFWTHLDLYVTLKYNCLAQSIMFNNLVYTHPCIKDNGRTSKRTSKAHTERTMCLF